MKRERVINNDGVKKIDVRALAICRILLRTNIRCCKRGSSTIFFYSPTVHAISRFSSSISSKTRINQLWNHDCANCYCCRMRQKLDQCMQKSILVFRTSILAVIKTLVTFSFSFFFSKNCTIVFLIIVKINVYMWTIEKCIMLPKRSQRERSNKQQ